MKKLKPIEHMGTYLIPEKGGLGLQASNTKCGIFLIVSVFLTMFPFSCNALAIYLRDLCS